MSDSIVKTIAIDAPVERVWAALTDHAKFGQWFQVEIDQPFVAGLPSTGRMTYPGFEDMPWEAQIVAIEPMTRFVYKWPATGGDKTAVETAIPAQEWTTVEFILVPSPGGTSLTVTESGFDAIAEPRRTNVMRSNDGGWAEQLRNIKAYVGG